VTRGGRVTEVREVQLSSVLSAMDVTPAGNTKLLNDVHPLKALPPIDNTELGTLTDDNEEHP